MNTSHKKYLTAVYLRLSSNDGEKVESDSIGNQRSLIQDYAKQNPEFTLVNEYIDDGYSGTNFDRPGFQKMIRDIEAGKINCVIVKDLSRLGRNYIETGRHLERYFSKSNVRFIAVTDHYDTANQSNDADQIIVPFKNLINDAYSRDISIKIRSQLDIKRKEGKFIGSFAGYGYAKDPADKNHLVIDEYAAGIVQLIFKLKLEGYSSQRIAATLNDMGVYPPMEYKRMCGLNFNSGFRSGSEPQWEVTTINRILRNELYLGTVVQGKRRKINYKVKKSDYIQEDAWIKVPGKHEAIIDPETFQYVQELLQQDTRIAPKRKTVYLFSGFLKCGDCGQNMSRRSATKKNKKYFYYHCSTYATRTGCSSHLINEELVYQAVLTGIQKQVALLTDASATITKSGELKYKKASVQTINIQLVELYKEIEKYKNLKIKLYEDYTEEILSREEYQELNQRFDKKIKEAEETRAELEARKQAMEEKKEDAHSWLTTFRSYGNIQELDRKTLITLIDHITVYDKKHIEIVFRFQEEMNRILSIAAMENSEMEGMTV